MLYPTKKTRHAVSGRAERINAGDALLLAGGCRAPLSFAALKETNLMRIVERRGRCCWDDAFADYLDANHERTDSR